MQCRRRSHCTSVLACVWRLQQWFRWDACGLAVLIHQEQEHRGNILEATLIPVAIYRQPVLQVLGLLACTQLCGEAQCKLLLD